jgi:integrase
MNTLPQAVQEYLRMRRDLGFKLKEAGKSLLDFVAFMHQRRSTFITSKLALGWAQQPRNVQPAHWARRLSIVRGFACYRSATDPRTQIPPQGLLPFQPQRARLYLYSDDEISRLLRAALDMPHRFERGALRPWVFHCLYGLLSVSGLRLGEALNLELRDVDLVSAVLTIRGQVRQGPSRSIACVHLQGARAIPRQTKPPLGWPSRVFPFVRLELGQSSGRRRSSPNLLCPVSADRPARTG